MKLRSPGFRSQLIFTAFDGASYDRGDRYAIHTLTNPNFFWGNLLVYDRPPLRGDYERWVAEFKREFTDPRIYHVTLAWESEAGAVGDVSEFLEHGFELEATAVLTASQVKPPPKFLPALEVRPLAGDAEWARMLDIRLACAHGNLPLAEWKDHYLRQDVRYRAMETAGIGHWYGGFLDGQLVAGLGIFHRDGLGRFQTVSTDPAFQRRGICGTLVYKSSELVLASGRVHELVMCADPDYHAIKIYESVGFERRQTEHGVYWWDKNRG